MRLFAPGEAPGIAGGPADVQVGMWRLADRAVLTVFNAGEKPANVSLKVDLEQLGLAPKRTWQDFIGVRDLYNPAGGKPAKLDFYEGVLTIPGLKGDSGRMTGLRLY